MILKFQHILSLGTIFSSASLFSAALHINPLSINTFSYTNQLNDTHTTLLHMGGYRAYRPNMGIFLKQDSLSPFYSTQTHNGFDYAAGNPMLYTDPKGHSPESVFLEFIESIAVIRKCCMPPSESIEAIESATSTSESSTRLRTHIAPISAHPGDASIEQSILRPPQSSTLSDTPRSPERRIAWARHAKRIAVSEHEEYYKHFYSSEELEAFRRKLKERKLSL